MVNEQSSSFAMQNAAVGAAASSLDDEAALLAGCRWNTYAFRRPGPPFVVVIASYQQKAHALTEE